VQAGLDMEPSGQRAWGPFYETQIAKDGKPTIAQVLSRYGSEITVAVRSSEDNSEEDRPADARAAAADAEPPSERPSAPGNKYSIFTPFQKKAIVFGAAAGALLSPLSGQIYFPALPALSRDLDVSINQINLTVTTYMVSCRVVFLVPPSSMLDS